MLSSRPGAIYQQHNARPHTARLSQQCLQGYDVLPWPARSPDLSPIEHVWVQNVKLGGHQTCLSINRLWNELCDMLRRLVRATAPGHHDCSIQE
ncbi:uncharacterized protein TNCV_2575881 [Trichonephila clavipes]|uniref:Tc1-like transposase DDE domain-containing protein n=1 Tax=Trichonephila clavipes TaxID=2585209 RepID=A0A8X6RBV1_TRICX|nr:uncharacterized protein TNCV_2575881 [Trichonephila clavipes]